jgi:hypothetical protein
MTGLIFLAAFLSSPSVAEKQLSPSAGPENLKINILVKQQKTDCPTPTGDEIVVCAVEKDNEIHRLRPIAGAGIIDKDESKAEFSISENVRLAAETDSAELGSGVISKRVMARVKIKF